MSKPQPIRVGDKFNTATGILEVIFTLPGGRIELFDREHCRFHNRYHREMLDWERVAP